jgi:two-component system, LytTR family, response regulator
MLLECIIVEDEPLAVERLTGFIAKLPYLQLRGSFDNAATAIHYVNTNAIDLIFLDINLGDISGIQFLEMVRPMCGVILTTAYPEYALTGFDLQVNDYLLKPFTFERFVQAVSRVETALSSRSNHGPTFLFIKTEYRLEKVLLEDVFYIQGMRDYRKIVTSVQPIMTLKTFFELEKEIPSNIICRVHKSYMVSVSKINSVERDRIRINGVYIPVSETYRKSFMDRLQYR